MEKYPPYSSIFQKLAFGESQMLDKAYYEEEVKRLTLSFDQQVGLRPTRTSERKEGQKGWEKGCSHLPHLLLISGATACDVCCTQKMCRFWSNVGMEMRSSRVAGV